MIKSKSWPTWGLLLAGCMPSCAQAAAADEKVQRIPGLLLGGGGLSAPEPVSVDPRLPRGARREVVARPVGKTPWCASSAPVCVHADPKSERAAGDSLRLLERAYYQVVHIAGLPAPSLDGREGGGPELDFYLGVSGLGSEALPSVTEQQLDGAALGPVELRQDRAAVFCVSAVSTLDAATAARCVAAATAARLDAAETPAIRDAYASFIADWLTASDTALLPATASWQLNPQLGALTRQSERWTRAASAWFSHWERQWGTGQRGQLASALLAMSRTVTKDAHPEWNNEPDVLDVLRSSLGDDARLIDSFRAFGVARVFAGRQDSTWLPGRAQSIQLRYDWELEYSSLPRRVAAARALEPLGNSFVRVVLDRVTLGARLALVIEWEAPVPMLWTVLALDAQGKEQRRWELPYLQKVRRVEQTLLDFESARELIVIGTNLGSVDLLHPFDPDQEPWEPHAYTLYLTELP